MQGLSSIKGKSTVGLQVEACNAKLGPGALKQMTAVSQTTAGGHGLFGMGYLLCKDFVVYGSHTGLC